MSTRSAGGNIRARRGHKERSKNFTELEKRTVLELIARHRDVLRQGRSNNATNRSKQLVWSSICEEVNKRCGGDRPRTPAQVKMWYENYKKKCKMRAHDSHNHVPQPAGGEAGLLDGMLWQNIHPLELKDELDAPASDALSGNDDDCLPVNMSNGRISSANESDDAMASVLEPQVTITPHSPPPRAPAAHAPLHHAIDARIQQNLLSKLSDASNAPLNLSSLEETRRSRSPPDPRADCTPHTTHEERLYFTAKRQHAIWEHEAKMKILNMELRQKEEIFSLQKQLFLIELRLKMDFLEKASESAHTETE